MFNLIFDTLVKENHVVVKSSWKSSMKVHANELGEVWAQCLRMVSSDKLWIDCSER